MKKEVILDNSKITIEKNNRCTLLYEEVFENKSINKSYEIIWKDNYMFCARSNEVNDSVSFTFNIDHPLFFPLLHLLDDSKKVIISDENNKNKFLEISRDDNNISMSFIGNDEYKCSSGYFDIFVSNKDYSLLKKTCSDLSIKERLLNFSCEISKSLFEEYHQISMEEYVLKKTLKK